MLSAGRCTTDTTTSVSMTREENASTMLSVAGRPLSDARIIARLWQPPCYTLDVQLLTVPVDLRCHAGCKRISELCVLLVLSSQTGRSPRFQQE